MRALGKLIVLYLFALQLLDADHVLHKFQVWGAMKSEGEKLAFYYGWTNGFFHARGAHSAVFVDCLEEMTSDQAIAILDKYYTEHPEKWSRPLGEQMLEALTVKGGTCEGKNPLK